MIILDSRRKIFAKTSKNDSQILKRRPILIWRPFSSPESIATYLFVTIDDIYDKLSSTETSFLRKLFQDPSLLYIMYNFSSLWDESETGERESIIEYFAQCFEWWSYRYCGEHIKWVVWACKDLLETFKSCRQLCSFNKITIYNADLRCIFPWCNGRRKHCIPQWGIPQRSISDFETFKNTWDSLKILKITHKNRVWSETW